MATAIHFEGVNTLWKGWEADENKEKVLDLPVLRTDTQSVSKWQLTKEELEEINKTGVVWLNILGTHPPVLVTGHQDHAIHYKTEE